MEAEWIIAAAAVSMVVVALAGVIWNHRTLNELKIARKAVALPVLEFGVSWNKRNVLFVIQNIGNGIARNIKLKTEFEGYDQKPIESENKNISPDNQNNWSLNMIPAYFLEHGSTVTMKIHCEFEDVYGEKFIIDKEQKMNEKTLTIK